MSDNYLCDADSTVRDWLEAAKATGHDDHYRSKRDAVRYRWDEPLEIKVGQEVHQGRARDISEVGIGLSVRFRMTAGAEVFLRRNAREPWVRGFVVHITPSVSTALVGVEILFDQPAESAHSGALSRRSGHVVAAQLKSQVGTSDNAPGVGEVGGIRMPETKSAEAKAVVQKWLDEAMCGAQPDNYHSKRQELRYSWRQPMEMLVDGHIDYVYTRDISAHGVGLTCRKHLAEQTLVHLRRDDSEPWVRARVAHATETVGSFKVGIELVFEF